MINFDNRFSTEDFELDGFELTEPDEDGVQYVLAIFKARLNVGRSNSGIQFGFTPNSELRLRELDEEREHDAELEAAIWKEQKARIPFVDSQ